MAGTEESTPELAQQNIAVIYLYNITYMLSNITYLSIYLSIYPCDDSTHQRTLQETLHSPSARWDRDPGIISPYAKT